jgi:hypothetical protein
MLHGVTSILEFNDVDEVDIGRCRDEHDRAQCPVIRRRRALMSVMLAFERRCQFTPVLKMRKWSEPLTFIAYRTAPRCLSS